MRAENQLNDLNHKKDGNWEAIDMPGSHFVCFMM
jgi:hypothetical protein